MTEAKFKDGEEVYFIPTKFQQEKHNLSSEYQRGTILCSYNVISSMFEDAKKIEQLFGIRRYSIYHSKFKNKTERLLLYQIREDNIQSVDDLIEEGVITNPIDLS